MSTVRFVHLTDLHYLPQPALSLPSVARSLLTEPRRLLGFANLHVLGRKRHLLSHNDREIVDSAFRHQLSLLKPDFLLFSGDFTNLSLSEEFSTAFHHLKGLLKEFPSFLIPGNHDYYTKRSVQEKRFESYFLPWMQGNSPSSSKISHVSELSGAAKEFPVFQWKFVRILGMNPCKAGGLDSNGEYPQWQLQKLYEILQGSGSLEGIFNENTFNAIMSHYPLLDRFGVDYSLSRRLHSALNNSQLIRLLENSRLPLRLFLHGHIHRGFSASLPLKNFSQPLETHDPGAFGVRYDPTHRTSSAFNLYSVTENSPNATAPTEKQEKFSLKVNRFLFNGETREFQPEVNNYTTFTYPPR